MRMTGCWVELQLEKTELDWPLSDRDTVSEAEQSGGRDSLKRREMSLGHQDQESPGQNQQHSPGVARRHSPPALRPRLENIHQNSQEGCVMILTGNCLG